MECVMEHLKGLVPETAVSTCVIRKVRRAEEEFPEELL